MEKFEINDEVKIISAGSVCSCAEELARRLGASNFEYERGELSGHIHDGMIGKITGKYGGVDYRGQSGHCYLIRLSDGYDYVFWDGFVLLKQKLKEVKKYGVALFFESIERRK